MENAGMPRPEETERNVHRSIEIRCIAASTRRRFELFSDDSSEQCCIYKVPERLRKINAEAYTPVRVSIGPMHYREEQLSGMVCHKYRYLQDFLKRNPNHNALEEILEFITEKKNLIRDCYAEDFNIYDDDFVEIILVDAAFIIEVLLRNWNPNLIPENDRILGKPWPICDIIRDMLLLENQIPYFVIEDLYGKAVLQHQYYGPSPPPLDWLAINFFKESSIIQHQPGEIDTGNVKHLIDFLRSCHRPIRSQGTQLNGVERKLASIKSATELHEAGVKFVVGSSKNLLDIKFTNGILEIPRIEITDFTECFLRNLLAFEQRHYLCGYMVDYAVFMDSLIKTSGDVELLVQKGIIERWLGENKDVPMLFNNLGKKIMTDSNDFDIAQLSKELNDYCKKRRHKWKANLRNWKASLRRDYFSSPWRVLSIVAASVLLVLTFIQTMCSVISARGGKW